MHSLIITPMGSSPPDLTARSILPLDRQDPHLRLSFVTVFVRDQDLSLRFYLDQRGFTLVFDRRLENGDRWLAVAPPDGIAMLALRKCCKPEIRSARNGLSSPSGSRGETEEPCYERHLPKDVILRQPANLSLAVGSRTGAVFRRSSLSVCSPFPLGVPH